MIDQTEASKIVQALDVSWQDVPLRPETIAVWEGELQQPENFIEFEDCVAAVKFLLATSARRPSYAELHEEARAQFKARRDARLEAVQLDQLEVERMKRMERELNQ